MAPCLSKFPSLCLETIFKHVPLVDLYYSVGLVCVSWYKSRRTELIRRRRLVLFADTKQRNLNEYRVGSWITYGTDLMERVRREDGSPWHTFETPEQFNFNLLLVPTGLAAPFFASLITNFPTISRLFVVLNGTDSILTDVIRLLDHLSDHLVELKLKLSYPYFDYTDFWNDDVEDVADDDDDDNDDRILQHLSVDLVNLITCLNRLPALRHLNLKMDLFFGHERFDLPPLSCLTRLVTFGFPVNAYRWVNDWFFASLRRYARNDISLEFTSTHRMGNINIQDIPQFDNQLAVKFNAFSVMYANVFMVELNLQPYDALRQFCSRFSALTKLELQADFDTLPMTTLARCLSLIPQLVQLDLRISLIPRAEPAQREIAQVRSVRLLSLSFSTFSHHDSEQLFIHAIFPNLQVLRLRQLVDNCEDCGIRITIGRRIVPRLARRIAECKRLTRQTFRRCANLHTIELVDGHEKTLLNVNQL